MGRPKGSKNKSGHTAGRPSFLKQRKDNESARNQAADNLDELLRKISEAEARLHVLEESIQQKEQQPQQIDAHDPALSQITQLLPQSASASPSRPSVPPVPLEMQQTISGKEIRFNPINQHRSKKLRHCKVCGDEDCMGAYRRSKCAGSAGVSNITSL